MPRSIWTKEREARFKTDFLPQKPDIEELQMCIDGLQKHRIDLEQQLAAANARIAELESECETCFSNYAKATGKLAERAEAAEAMVDWQERDYRTILSAIADTIEDQEKRIAERDAKINRQERMIERACERLESGDCLFEDEPCPKNYIEVGCRGCARRWLEQEAGK